MVLLGFGFYYSEVVEEVWGFIFDDSVFGVGLGEVFISIFLALGDLDVLAIEKVIFWIFLLSF